MNRWIFAIAVFSLSGCTGGPYIDQLAGERKGDVFFHRQVFVAKTEDQPGGWSSEPRDGHNLYVAIDATKYRGYADPIRRQFRIHVLPHASFRTRAGQDLAGLDVSGVAPEDRTYELQPGQVNQFLVWENMHLPYEAPPSLGRPLRKPYDIIIDLLPFDQFDKDQDIIDSIDDSAVYPGSGGFWLVRDPAQWHSEGGAKYTDFPALNIDLGSGPVELSYQFFGPYELRGWPHDELKNPPRPLIVIAPGGGPTSGYHSLAEFLADTDFVCAVIDLEPFEDWGVQERKTAIEMVIRLLTGDEESDAVREADIDIPRCVDKSRIGLIGHGRSGEAVALIATNAGEPDDSFSVKAVAALSPTDSPPDPSRPHGSGPAHPRLPFLLLYGTRDRINYASSLAANKQGFRIYDRAARPRHAVTIYRGNYHHFNGAWPDDGVLGDVTLPDILERDSQQRISRTYLNAFFRAYLLNMSEYAEFLSGDTLPPGLLSSGELLPLTTLQFSHQPRTDGWRRLVDDFEEQLLFDIPLVDDAVEWLNSAGWWEEFDEDDFLQMIERQLASVGADAGLSPQREPLTVHVKRPGHSWGVVTDSGDLLLIKHDGDGNGGVYHYQTEESKLPGLPQRGNWQQYQRYHNDGVVKIRREALRDTGSNSGYWKEGANSEAIVNDQQVHDTWGLRVRWISQGNQNLLPYVAFPVGALRGESDREGTFLGLDRYLSLRVAQIYRYEYSTGAPMPGRNLNETDASQDFTIKLVDSQNESSNEIRASRFSPILFPDHVTGNSAFHTKAIMQTVRIPVAAFTAACPTSFDLRNVRWLIFTFQDRGELIFDDIEFYGLDVSEPEWTMPEQD